MILLLYKIKSKSEINSKYANFNQGWFQKSSLGGVETLNYSSWRELFEMVFTLNRTSLLWGNHVMISKLLIRKNKFCGLQSDKRLYQITCKNEMHFKSTDAMKNHTVI